MLARRAEQPFISPETMASAECLLRDGASYLAVSIDPAYTAAGLGLIAAIAAWLSQGATADAQGGARLVLLPVTPLAVL